MRAVVTRVAEASVTVDGKAVAHIGKGLLILLGVAPEDTPELCRKMAQKICGLRIFSDPSGKMNLDAAAAGGALLVVSQFTLYGDCSHGRRPCFAGAAQPEPARALYEQFLAECAAAGFPPEHGIFGAHMEVSSLNDGPVTLLLDSDTLSFR